MSKTGGVLVVVLSLLAGFGGGWGYQTLNGGTTTSGTATTTTTASSTQSLADCLKGVWGDDKYAALTANSSLATTEDNFAALTCYQAK
jgi:hypothetical protein